MSRCKPCVKEASRAFRLKHPEKDRQYYLNTRNESLPKFKVAYANDAELRAKISERSRKYYEQNRERIKERTRQYAVANSDKLKEYRKTYNARPDVKAKGLIACRVYRAKPETKPKLVVRSWKAQQDRRNAPGKCTPTQLQARIDYYGGLCWICSVPYQAIDHYKPITKGGCNWPANLRPICKSCNSRKGNRWPYNKLITV